MLRATTLAFLLVLLAAPSRTQAPPDSVGRLIDLQGLPVLDNGVTCRQFASTDPAGRGDDHGHFVRREGDRCVLASMKGPGVIVRLWSANAQGRLHVFFDGEEQPRIDCPFQDLFTGKYPPFVTPISIHASGGWISYFPIPYARSCRVEVSGLEDPNALYYHVQYLTYPPGTKVRTFTRELPQQEKARLAEVLRLWRTPGPVPSPRAKDTKRSGTVELAAFGKTPLVELQGAGSVERLTVRPENATPAALRGLVLEVCFDGAAEPSVCAPLGDFFGVGFGVTPYRGLALGWTKAEGGYCNFVMPFRKRARILVRNATADSQRLSWSLVWRKGEPPPTAGYFHAEFRSVDGVGDNPYEFANVEGHGKYVGLTQALQGVGDLWYLEGNERFFVDGETRPSIDGTGTEDFYNGGWYWNRGTFALPLHGLNVKEEWKSNRTTPYRIQLPDAVPFAKSLVACIEHGSRNEVRDAYYSSVAFWYGNRCSVRRPSAVELVPPRQWVVLPRGFSAASGLAWHPAVERRRWGLISETYRGLDRPLSQAFPVSYVEHDKPAVDARVVLLRRGERERIYLAEVEVPHSDRWRFTLRFVGTPVPARVQLRVDGTPIGGLEVKAARVQPLEPRSFGPVPLFAGSHRLELVLPAGHSFVGVDAIRISPASPFVRSWRVASPVPAKRGGTVEDEMDVESTYLAPTFDPAAAGWKKVQSRSDRLDLNRVVSSQSPMLAYLMFAVKSPTKHEALALLGSDDGVRVWVNGTLRWSHAIHRDLTRDEDKFEVPLEAGWNRILVKVKNDYGAYGVTLRIADPDGSLLVTADPFPR